LVLVKPGQDDFWGALRGVGTRGGSAHEPRVISSGVRVGVSVRENTTNQPKDFKRSANKRALRRVPAATLAQARGGHPPRRLKVA